MDVVDVFLWVWSIMSIDGSVDSHLFGVGDESVSEDEEGEDEPVAKGPLPASACLDLFCSQFRRCPSAFLCMLRETNERGFTPFMCAVECKVSG